MRTKNAKKKTSRAGGAARDGLANHADFSLLDTFWRESVTRTVLPNGLVVLVKPDHSAPVASVQVWVRAGSIHEVARPGAGLSHYLEHMLFKGTRGREAREISAVVQAHGGVINAYTTFDRTVYHVDLPSEHAPLAIDVLADMALRPALAPAEAARERDVILREIDMCRDDPEARTWEMLFDTAFTRHPYRYPVIGYKEAFASVTHGELLAYYRSRYVPGNMVVVVAGDVDAAGVLAEVEGRFGAAPPARPAPAPAGDEPVQLAPRAAHYSGDVEITRAVLAWQSPGIAHPDAPALDMLATILGAGDSSVLWQAIREKARLVHTIDAQSWTPPGPGLFSIAFTCDAEKRDAAIGAVAETLERRAAEGFSAAQARKAARQLIVGEINSRKTMAGQAARLGASEVVAGDLNYARAYFGRLRKLTPADLKRVLKEHLVPERLTAVSLNPKGKGVVSGTDGADWRAVGIDSGARAGSPCHAEHAGGAPTPGEPHGGDACDTQTTRAGSPCHADDTGGTPAPLESHEGDACDTQTARAGSPCHADGTGGVSAPGEPHGGDACDTQTTRAGSPCHADGTGGVPAPGEPHGGDACDTRTARAGSPCHAEHAGGAPARSAPRGLAARATKKSAPWFEEIRMPNGARLLLQQEKRLPSLHVQMLFQGGPLFEEAGKRGATALLGTMLTRDTRRRAAAEVALAIEEIGGALNSFSGNNSIGIGVEVLSGAADVERGLEVLGDAVFAPLFKRESFETEREALLAALAQDADDVVTRGHKLARKKFFGAHPLAHDASGDEAGVRALEPADLAALWGRLFVAGNTVLAVAGDFEKAGLLPKLERLLGGVPGGVLSGGAGVPPGGRAGDGAGDFAEARPCEQTVVYQAFPGPGVLAGDYYAGEVADEFFSGMSSRLFERVREEKGLAYFVRASRVSGLRAGMFVFFAGTSPARHEEVLREIDAEIARVQAGEFGGEEVERCRVRLKAGRRMGLQTNAARATQAGLNALYGLKVNDWLDYDKNIDAVGAATLRDFARRHFRRELRTQLVVGAGSPGK